MSQLGKISINGSSKMRIVVNGLGEMGASLALAIKNGQENAEIIGGGSKHKVSLGNEVSLKNLANNKIVKYSLVGPVEANPLEGKISNESPIGEKLMGKKLDEEVEISTPKNSITYKIVEIN